MESIQKYYDNTQSDKPRNNVEYFINEIQCNSGNAIELGCGAGNDTVYLIKNNWNVLAIDREDVPNIEWDCRTRKRTCVTGQHCGSEGASERNRCRTEGFAKTGRQCFGRRA